MAGGSFGCVRAACAGLALGLALCAAGFAAAAEDADAPAAGGHAELLGTWHVLVHYTDANAKNEHQLRWHDRLWIFEEKSGKLVWTEYPIVVFGDDTGRFERRSSGQYARVLGGWEPSYTQLGNIRVGLRTNTRGMKSKKLRGSDAEGWATSSQARAASASVITYQENWSVEFRDGLPVFEQRDVMGSARAESLEGVTRFSVESRRGERQLVGSYERDGTQRGQFWMRRSGDRLGLDQDDRPLPVTGD